MRRRDGMANVALAMRVAGGARLEIARIRRRAAGGLIGPGFEIADGVDDAAAELAKGRAIAVAAIFLERARRDTQEARRLRGAHVTGGELRGPIEHGRSPSC